MHKLLLKKVIDNCRKIKSEGDCKVTESFSIEMLEEAVLDLSREKKDIEYIASKGCTSKDGKHVNEKYNSPYYEKCTICGMRFYLIAEDVFDNMGINMSPRQVIGH